jgi:citrate lyase subunit beta/citryl-CoA lyase
MKGEIKNMKTLEWPFRSLMFVPGHNQRLMESAARSDADILLLDLEDSVRPIENKSKARSLIRKMVSDGIFSKHLIFPRVNDRESGHLLKDVYELTIDGIHGFTYPKAKAPEDIYFFDKLLETIEYEKNIPVGTFKIIALIETTGAIINIGSIASSSKRLVALAFGCEDYVTDLGGFHDAEGMSIFTPRAMIANAARSAGIIPIDTVHIRVHDLEDLENNLILAKKLGFEGMLVLHPKELPLVHQYFSPSEKEVSEAQEMLTLARTAEAEGKGVAVYNDRFVGPPMVEMAKSLLERHRIIQKKLGKP